MFYHPTPVLLDQQEYLHATFIGVVYQPTFCQVALTLVRLLCEDVTFVRMLALQHSRTCQGETFHRSTVRLHLWHSYNVFIRYNSMCIFALAIVYH